MSKILSTSQVPNTIGETEISAPAITTLIPVVSVFMSVYNHGLYLAEAIEGVVSQKTDFPIELIIGEDCSTDNSRDIALQYQKRYPHIIRVVYSDKNIGGFNNANRCMAKVRGEFVAYCEGDDYWHEPQKLKKQVDFLRANPDFGLVHSDFDYLVYTFSAWRRIQRWYRTNHLTMLQGSIYADFLTRSIIRTCTIMCRSSLLKQHFTSMLRAPRNPIGDRPLALHLSKLSKTGYIDESLATYRRVPGSYSNSSYDVLLQKQKEKIEMDRMLVAELGADESDKLVMERGSYRLVLYFSLAAQNVAEFQEALVWLRVNFPEFAKSKTVALWSYLIKHPRLISLFMKFRTFMRELDLFLKSFGIRLRRLG